MLVRARRGLLPGRGRADPDDTREDWTPAAAVALVEILKADINDEEMCPILAGCSLDTHLLRAALGEVDWYEIAAHYAESRVGELADDE